MKKRPELNYMNAIASLCVVLIHVLSIAIFQVERTSWKGAAIYFPWRLSAYVVPMFLYTGALKMARQFADRTITPGSYWTYCVGRVKKIYLPYVLWVVIYFFSFLQIGYVRGEAGEFFQYLFTGTLSSPFYYIILVMQFYFLMPLWVWMVRHVPAWLGMTMGLLVTVCMQGFPQLLAGFGVEFAYTDRVFATYLIFWMAGLYAGKHYEAFQQSLQKRCVKPICAVLVLLCAWLGYLQYCGTAVPFHMDNVKMMADLLSIGLLHSICISLTRAPAKIQHTLQGLAGASFFLYLSHCLFLTLGTAWLQGRGVTDLSLLLSARALVCYTAPFLVWFVYSRTLSRTKWGRGLLG